LTVALALGSCAGQAAGPGAPAIAPSAGPNVPPAGFTALFNGRDLAGWRGSLGRPKDEAALSPEARATAADAADAEMRAHWRVEGDTLLHDGKGKNLVSSSSFGDLELLVDWRIEACGDSGIYLRGLPQVGIWDPDCPRDQKHGAAAGSGAIWNNLHGANRPLVRADRRVGEWNHMRIRLVGEHTWVWLNDRLVVDDVRLENAWERDKPAYARGPIELQTHGSPLWFRNLFVREITHEEAVATLTRAEEQSFTPLWNGKDFTGWRGALDQYEIVDGGIRCKAGKGGHIFTEGEFADFVVRLEFLLPPGGNNGLALRYPGTGDPAYAAMTEIQVLDSEHEKYAKLDPRQFHGSAYGIAAAHRGYLRPTGQWNYEQVTLKGSRVTVELNGTTILDRDLSTVTSFLDGKQHPGLTRTSGHVGFAGHNDPVAFRALRIKEL
jgi:hypothetical protein